MLHKFLADGFFVLASIGVLVSIYSWSVEDVWLASTQWLLITIVLLLMAIYIKISKEEDEEIIRKRKVTTKKRK